MTVMNTFGRWLVSRVGWAGLLAGSVAACTALPAAPAGEAGWDKDDGVAGKGDGIRNACYASTALDEAFCGQQVPDSLFLSDMWRIDEVDEITGYGATHTRRGFPRANFDAEDLAFATVENFLFEHPAASGSELCSVETGDEVVTGQLPKGWGIWRDPGAWYQTGNQRVEFGAQQGSLGVEVEDQNIVLYRLFTLEDYEKIQTHGGAYWRVSAVMSIDGVDLTAPGSWQHDHWLEVGIRPVLGPNDGGIEDAADGRIHYQKLTPGDAQVAAMVDSGYGSNVFRVRTPQLPVNHSGDLLRGVVAYIKIGARPGAGATRATLSSIDVELIDWDAIHKDGLPEVEGLTNCDADPLFADGAAPLPVARPVAITDGIFQARNGYICPGFGAGAPDEDWFVFDSTTPYQIFLEHNHSTGDLDMLAFDRIPPDEQTEWEHIIGWSVSTTDNEFVNMPEGGRAYVRVFGYAGAAGNYELRARPINTYCGELNEGPGGSFEY